MEDNFVRRGVGLYNDYHCAYLLETSEILWNMVVADFMSAYLIQKQKLKLSTTGCKKINQMPLYKWSLQTF
jgi:hypothetical protein